MDVSLLMKNVSKAIALTVGTATLGLTAIATPALAQAPAPHNTQPHRVVRDAAQPAALEFFPPYLFNKGSGFGSGPAQLVFSDDGNLVLRNQGGAVLWTSDTAGRGQYAVFGADGDLVVYDAGNTPIWESGTAGTQGATLWLDPAGRLSIYNNAGQVVWQVGTGAGVR